MSSFVRGPAHRYVPFSRLSTDRGNTPGRGDCSVGRSHHYTQLPHFSQTWETFRSREVLYFDCGAGTLG